MVVGPGGNFKTCSQMPRMIEHELSDSSYMKLKKQLVQSTIPESTLGVTRESKGGYVDRTPFSYGMVCIFSAPFWLAWALALTWHTYRQEYTHTHTHIHKLVIELVILFGS